MNKATGSTIKDTADFLFGTGFLTDEQRAEVVKYETRRGFVFTSRRDLAGNIHVLCPRFAVGEKSLKENLADAVSEFIGNFCIWTLKRLNGFNGFDTLHYVFEYK